MMWCASSLPSASRTPFIAAGHLRMNKDQIDGRIEQAKGKAAEIVGRVVVKDKAKHIFDQI